MQTRFFAVTPLLVVLCVAAHSQGGVVTSAGRPASELTAAPELKYVLTIERHGVRSPTGKAAQYEPYSQAAWPEWKVTPGYLTPHGFALIKRMGAYDREALAARGLLSPAGCSDAHTVTIYGDSDQRTRETGKALAEGLFPGCPPAVLGKDEGIGDPLFHVPGTSIPQEQAELARAAIAGRIGDDPAGIAMAYHQPLAAFDHLLASCGAPVAGKQRTSIFDVPVKLSAGSGDHAADLRGPLSTASTLTENLLLEYTEGMPMADVGWGCVDGSTLRSLIDLHTAASDLAQRTPAVAALQAAPLLKAIAASLAQAATRQVVEGARGNIGDRALFLIGHDTNLSNLAGALGIDWLLDGRRDDTPPGSALVFELWHAAGSKDDSVRVYFTAQTLEQMRSGVALSSSNPPPRVPVFVPGCSHADFSCPLPAMLETLQHAAMSAR